MDILNFLDLGTIATLTTAGLTVAASVFGAKYKKYVNVVRQLLNMVEDDQITKEELKKFVKTIKNL